MWRALAAADRWITHACRAGVILALVTILALLTLGVLARAVPGVSVAGYEEVVELLVAWMTFLGAAALWRGGLLYRVDVLTTRLALGPARVVALVVRLLMLLFAVVFTVKGWEIATRSAETTTFLRFPKSLAYASMPVAGLLMTLYAAAGIWQTRAGGRPGR